MVKRFTQAWGVLPVIVLGGVMMCACEDKYGVTLSPHSIRISSPDGEPVEGNELPDYVRLRVYGGECFSGCGKDLGSTCTVVEQSENFIRIETVFRYTQGRARLFGACTYSCSFASADCGLIERPGREVVIIGPEGNIETIPFPIVSLPWSN